MRLTIGVCDDEGYFRQQITQTIQEELAFQDGIEYTIDTFSNGQELFQNPNQIKEWDVLFMDISMPGENGMQVAAKVKQQNEKIILVFITSYIDFAIEGYKINALRYVLKKDLKGALPEAVDAVCRQMKIQKKELFYDCLEGRQLLAVPELYYIESKGHKLQLNVRDDRVYTMYGKLDDLEEQLNAYNFIRIHKSFLVNYQHIRSIKNYILTLDNGVELMIPRERYRQVKEQYYELRGGLQ